MIHEEVFAKINFLWSNFSFLHLIGIELQIVCLTHTIQETILVLD